MEWTELSWCLRMPRIKNDANSFYWQWIRFGIAQQFAYKLMREKGTQKKSHTRTYDIFGAILQFLFVCCVIFLLLSLNASCQTQNEWIFHEPNESDYEHLTAQFIERHRHWHVGCCCGAAISMPRVRLLLLSAPMSRNIFFACRVQNTNETN